MKSQNEISIKLKIELISYENRKNHLKNCTVKISKNNTEFEKDNFEILLQFEGKPHQVKLLRLNPQKVKLPFDLCQSLQFVLN